MSNPLDALGLSAGALTTIAFLPQLFRLYATKSGHDISLGMMLIFSLGVGLWLAYGLLIGSLPLIVANLVTLVLALAILALKLHYARARNTDPGPR